MQAGFESQNGRCKGLKNVFGCIINVKE